MTQYGEHELILGYFQGRLNAGRFLDIGAGDGITWSNTQPLLAHQWSGVMVEPAPSQLRRLYENYVDNQGVEIAPFAIGETQRAAGVTLWDCGDFSTVNAAHRNLVHVHSEGKAQFRERRTVVLTWLDLLSLHPGPYQFVNIDVEGNNTEVLASMPEPSLLLDPEMVCIEIDPQYQLEWMKQELCRRGLANQQVVGAHLGGNLLAWK